MESVEDLNIFKQMYGCNLYRKHSECIGMLIANVILKTRANLRYTAIISKNKTLIGQQKKLDKGLLRCEKCVYEWNILDC